MLTVKTKEATPGTPNMRRNGFSSILPMACGIPIDVMKFAQIKKGSNAGKTELAHKVTPFRAAVSATDGHAIIAIQPMQDSAPAVMYFIFLLFQFPSMLHHIQSDEALCKTYSLLSICVR